MSYSEHIAEVVADQMERFVTLNRHQLAGHVGNLDFWVAQARHALSVIDGYEERFRLLRAAQDEYVDVNRVALPSRFDPDVAGRPAEPRRVPHGRLRDARRRVADATYRFLVRLCNYDLMPESQLRTLCGNLGIGVEASDLRR